jgi:hypothetical protein
MIRWICGLKAKYIFSTASLYEKLGIQDVSTLPSQHRIRWAGHVHRSTSWTSQGQTIVVEDSIDRGRPRKTWNNSTKEDLTAWNLSMDMAAHCC